MRATAAFAVHSFVRLVAIVDSYVPPQGPDMRTAHVIVKGQFPGTHGDITQAALRLLEADGRGEAAASYTQPDDMAALYDGIRQASTAAGHFNTELYGSSGTVPRNALSHYFNPQTREGMVFPLPEESADLNPSPEVILRARWEVSMLAGPHPSATDVVDWEYAKAVAARRAGDRTAAYTALGRALHVMQGLTVPHHSTDTPAGIPNSNKALYEDLCEQILRNASLGTTAAVHPASGGIYCDACPPSEFAETAANQSARFLGAAQQPDQPQTAAVASVLLAAADKLTAGLLNRFHAQWAAEQFTVLRISIERIRALYMYQKKGEEGEHYLLAKGRNRAADLSAVVVIDGVQRRTPTARNCNDVRPRQLLGALDLNDDNYAGPETVTDCSMVYVAPADETRPNDDASSLVGWTFTKRIALAGPQAVDSVLIQVVVLDDLVEHDDKRVDVAPGEERRNLVFEYSVHDDTIVGLDAGAVLRSSAGDQLVHSKGEGSRAAALTVRVQRTPTAAAELGGSELIATPAAAAAAGAGAGATAGGGGGGAHPPPTGGETGHQVGELPRMTGHQEL